ncbi:MAG: TetR/AcrR family transcriptional regulator [Candidatus Izemoplasmatales bacterium]
MNDRTYYLRSNSALYNATIEMFSNKSFESASLNDIIKESNSNKGSFYYRFKDKQELYFALIDAMFVEQITYVNLRLEGSTEQTPKGYLTLLFESLIDVSREDIRYLNLNQQLFRESSDFYENVIQNTIKSPYERILKRITDTEVKLKPFWAVTIHRFYGDFILYYRESDFNLDRFIDILSIALFENSNEMVSKENYLAKQIQLSTSFLPSVENNQIYGIIDPFFNKSTLFDLMKSFQSDTTTYISNRKLPFEVDNQVLLSKKLSSKLKVFTYLTKELKKKSVMINLDLFQSIDWMSDSIHTLDKVSQKMVLIFLALQEPKQTFVIYHSFDDFNEGEKAKLFEFLLKYRPNGSKIVLIDNNVHLSYYFASTITMIGSKNQIHTYQHSDLVVKYPTDSVIIKESNEYELVSANYFSSSKKLHKSYFYSLQSYLNIIYQIEMGESCDE